MLPTAPHSIRRQVLDVELDGSEADALALQRMLPALSAGALAPAIAQALDRCAPGTDWIRIEHLEVDAGSVAWSRLEQDLPGALQRALESALMVRMPPGLPSGGPGLVPVAGRAHGEAPGAVPGWRRSSIGQSLDEALAYFLVNGSLPSACHLAPGMSFEQTLLAVWQAAPAEGGGSAAGGATLADTLVGEVARERLTAQFSGGLLQVLLSRLTRHSAQAVAAIVPAFGDAGLAADAERRLALRWWQAVFAGITAGGAGLPLAALAQAATDQAWAAAAAAAATAPARRRAAPAGRAPASTPARKGRRRHAEAGQGGAPGHGRAGIGPSPERATPPPHPDAEQGIFINNAGLVLLHPFLNRLLAALALSEGDRLLQPDRALHLLHYLASGRAGAPEYELVLPKVLCNVPLTQPVAADTVLGEAERAEAHALLEAVVGHWSALRNTSADGLRAAFLLRPGKLSRRNGEWLLQVEPDTADILLNQLPWGISPVKLPWMDRLMWVEWG